MERFQIDAVIQGKAVKGDTLLHCQAQRGDFFPFHPNAGVPGLSAGLEVVIRQGTNEYLFQQKDIIPDP